MSDKIRKEFEQWRDEKPNQRYGEPVWEAYQAGCASRQEEIDALQAIIRDWTRRSESCESRLGQLEANEHVLILTETLASVQKPPIEPEEVWSPHTKVIE